MNIEKARVAMAARSTHEATAMPPELASLPADRIIDVDVREDLRNGIEPFGTIMAAQARVPAGAAMTVRATFEPVPLYAVLGKQGFAHWTERVGDDDWCVWFYRGELVEASAACTVPPVKAAPAIQQTDEDLVILDVRGLEPPEPMARTLLALDRLADGQSLLQVNARVPQFLLPMLEERGYEYVLVSEQPDEVRGLIRRMTT